MTTYLLITSDKPTELTAFVGPKKPEYPVAPLGSPKMEKYLALCKEYGRKMETAKASRLPVVNAEEIGVHPFANRFMDGSTFSDVGLIKLDTPVELEGWEPEIVYQEAYLSGEGEIWKKCSIDRFNNIRHLDCKRKAYRLKRLEPVKQRACREICGDAACIHEGCAFTRNESPIEAKTQEPYRSPYQHKDCHSFCEKGPNYCNTNYCDENGCNERKRSLVDITPESHKTQESQTEIWKDLINLYDTTDRSSYGYASLVKALSEKFILTRRNP